MNVDLEIKLFISYSHKDKEYKEDFLTHIHPLKSNGIIDAWHDRELVAGDRLDEEIVKALGEYDIFVFLISPDFLKSEYCMDKELNSALNRMEIDQSRIFPVVVRHCGWKDTSIKDFVAVPEDGIPIVSHDDKDAVWQGVVEHLKRSISVVVENKQKQPIARPDSLEVGAGYQVKDQFLAFIEDTGVKFQHQQREHPPSLKELFVYPYLKYLGDDPQEYEISKGSESVFESILDKKILVLGDEQSGKTSLAKMLYGSWDDSVVTVYVSARKIGSTDPRSWLQAALKEQYTNLDLDSFQKLDATKVLLIDDYTEIKLNRKYQTKLLNNLEEAFDALVVFSDKSLQNSEFEFTLFGSYQHFELLDFGHVLQTRLIEKWVVLGKEETISEEEKLRQLDEYKIHIDSVLRKNIVPPKPLYILTVLQSLEAFNQSDFGLTSYGHCYQYLIQQNLYKANIGKNEIDPYINFLTELAYFLFESGNNALSKAEFDVFQNRYSSEYVALGSGEKMISTLLDSGILIFQNEEYRFSYKYIFYFYAAKYIADHLQIESVRVKVEYLCERLHSEKHSNILVFITHHTRDPSIIDDIRLYTSTIFENVVEADLGEENTRYLKDCISEIPSLFVEDKDVEVERQKSLELRDEIEAQFEDDSQDEKDDLDDQEDLDTLSFQLAEISRSAKAVEIIGQILRNRYGSMKKPDLLDLASDAYSVGLRFLNFYLRSAEEIKEELITHISEQIDDNKVNSIEEKEKLAKKFYLGLCYGMSWGVIKKISISVGTNKLLEIFDSIEEAENTPAKRLINLAIYLEFKKSIPRMQISNMLKDFGGNFLCLRMLQEIVIQHMYMHYTSTQDKQWISSTLGIPMASQRMLENESNRKIRRK